MKTTLEHYRQLFESIRLKCLGPVEKWHRFFIDPEYERECENLPLAMRWTDYGFLAGLPPQERDQLILVYAVATWQLFTEFAFKHHNIDYLCQIVVYDETEETPESPLFPKLSFMRRPEMIGEIRSISQAFGFKLVSMVSKIKTELPAIVREGPIWRDVGPIFYIDFDRRNGELRKTIADPFPRQK